MKTALSPWLALSALILVSAPARGSKPRIRVERIDASRCAEQGIARVFAIEHELEGQVRRRRASEYRLVSGNRTIAKRAERAMAFSKSGQGLTLALVLQNTASYRRAMGPLKRALDRFLSALPEGTRVTISSYSWEVERLVARSDVAKARRALAGLDTVASPKVDRALVLALRSALVVLEKEDRKRRRVLVVVSDGMDRFPLWSTFRAIGKRAGRAGIPIFSVAYSPIDERGPLLNLGELSKRSRGWLRWVRREEQFEGQLDNLAREINEQQILSFRLAKGCEGVATLRLVAGALSSRPVAIAAKGVMPRKKQGPRPGVAEPVVQPWKRIAAIAGLVVIVFGVIAGTTVYALWGRRRKAIDVPTHTARAEGSGHGGAGRAPPSSTAQTSPVEDPPSGRRQTVATSHEAEEEAGWHVHGMTMPVLGRSWAMSPRGLRLGAGSPGCAISLGEKSGCAAEHADLFEKNGRLFVRHLGVGQTLVNGRAVALQELRDGDVLCLGYVQLLIRWEARGS